MRTTLNIADDIMMAVKERARRQQRSAGDLLSELAREALTHQYGKDSDGAKPKGCFGFEPLPARGMAISNQLIDKLREEELE